MIASSRGHKMTYRMWMNHPDPQNLLMFTESSLKLWDINRNISSYLGSIPKSQLPDTHVYLLAGICDLTFRDYDKYYNEYEIYDEVTFSEHPDQAVARVSKTILAVTEKIAKLGAVPCIPTIVPCSLDVYNNYRLNEYKTSFLLHYPKYSDMQENLITTIDRLNKFIIGVNKTYNMITPQLADTIRTNMGKGKPHRVHYMRLKDGNHPTKVLADLWSDKMLQAMANNRYSRRQIDTDWPCLEEDLETSIMESLNRSAEEELRAARCYVAE